MADVIASLIRHVTGSSTERPPGTADLSSSPFRPRSFSDRDHPPCSAELAKLAEQAMEHRTSGGSSWHVRSDTDGVHHHDRRSRRDIVDVSELRRGFAAKMKAKAESEEIARQDLEISDTKWTGAYVLLDATELAGMSGHSTEQQGAVVEPAPKQEGLGIRDAKWDGPFVPMGAAEVAAHNDATSSASERRRRWPWQQVRVWPAGEVVDSDDDDDVKA